MVLLIDELQELKKSQMSAVCRSCHRAGQPGLPWFVIGGGLPNLPTQLAESESYAGRLFDYRTVDRLPASAARVALTKPAAAKGVSWDEDAVQFLVEESGGYPYFLQQFGKLRLGRVAGPAISLEDAKIGVTIGHQQLDVGFYSSRIVYSPEHGMIAYTVPGMADYVERLDQDDT